MRTHLMTDLVEQLANTLAAATTLTTELQAALQAGADQSTREPGPARPRHHESSPPSERLHVDSGTLSVSWGGKVCHLGYTIPFRLVERLARRPNYYLSEADLVRDVWDGHRVAPETIRSSLRHLRGRLHEAGMSELAQAIRTESGRYALVLQPD